MFDIILKYTTRTLFRKRKQFILSVISIVLCITAIISAGSVCWSLYKSYNDCLHNTYGDYTGVLAVNSQEMKNEIENDQDIKQLGYLYDIGTVSSGESIYDGQITVAKADKSALNQANINLISGRLPQSADEIAVEESTATKLNTDFEIGQEADFKIKLSGEAVVSRKLTVVGIVHDYSGYQQMKNKDEVSIWPGVILSECDEELSSGMEVYAVINSQGNNAETIQKTAQKYKSSFFINQRYDKESSLGTIDDSTKTILSIVAVSVVLIAILCLSSFISVNASALMEQYNNLKLLGAGKSTLILFGVINISETYLISLPLGLLLGILGADGLSAFIVKDFVDFYSFKISPLIIIAGAVIPLLLILIIRILHFAFNNNLKPIALENKIKVKGKRSHLPIKDIALKWTIVSMRNNRSAYIGIVISIAICLFNLFVGSFFNQTIADQYDDKKYYDNYEIDYTDGLFVSSFQIFVYPSSGIGGSIAYDLFNNGEVENYSYIKKTNILVAVDKESELADNMNEQSVRDFERNDSNYNEIAKEYNIDLSDDVYIKNIYGCDDMLIEKLLGQKNINGDTDAAALKDGRSVIAVCGNSSKCPFKAGDTVNMIKFTLKDDKDISAKNTDKLDFTVKVAAVVEIDKNNNYLSSKFSGYTFVWSADAFESKGIDLNYNSLYINLKSPDNYSETEKLIGKIKYLYPDAWITSERENNSMKYSLINTIDFSVGILIIFIYAICIFNIINIINMKYLSQKKLWGTLRSMGITRGTVIKQHIFEIICISAASVLLNVILLSIVNDIIRRDVVVFNSVMYIGYFLVFILTFLITIPIVTSIFRQNIVKQIEYID